MRASRFVTIGVLTALITAFSVAPAHAARVVNYIALGDSYSSGLGASSSYTDGSCNLSANAYSALWNAAHSPTSYQSVACAGATTSSVIGTQVSSLSRSTNLVSITVGGNDTGFSTIMLVCVFFGTSACVTAVNSAESTAASTLPAKLDSTYSAISARAPSARVVVLGYPLFYQLHMRSCVAVSETSRAKIDEGIGQVDRLIAAVALRHGFIFADVRSAFVGHQLCSGNPWLHGVDLGNISDSFHPTAAGQRGGYLSAFTSAAGS